MVLAEMSSENSKMKQNFKLVLQLESNGIIFLF